MTIDGSHVAWPPLSPDGGDHQPPKYRDFSSLGPEDVPPSPQPSLRAARRRKGPKELSFPTKLHDLLTNCTTGDLSHIISWQDHGRSFVITDTKQFATRIMPSYFRQSKFHSFQRQLNLYGFKRLGTGPDKGGYYHELFLREKRFLAKKMKRTKVKGVGRQPYFPDAEPDFYDLPFLPDLGGGYVNGSQGRTMRPSVTSKSEEIAVVSTTSSIGGGVSVGGISNSSVTSSGGLSTYDDPSVSSIGGQFPVRSTFTAPTPMLVGFPTPPMNCIAALRKQKLPFPNICASDNVARSAQKILAEVKGTFTPEFKATHGTGSSPSRLLASPALPQSNEADMILGTLSAVAPYYNFGTRATSKSSQPLLL